MHRLPRVVLRVPKHALGVPKRNPGARWLHGGAARAQEAAGDDKQRAPPLRAHTGPFPARTHHAGTLSAQHAGHPAVLTGWLLPPRKIGKGFLFFPLRDPHGTVQLVVDARALDPAAVAAMCATPPESTVCVRGTVRERPEGQKRPVPAGDVELAVSSFLLLNPADRALPFAPSDERNLPNEEHRLRYRYLDLRRPALAANLQKRSAVAHVVRTTLHDLGFVEVETPMLLKSTPEGAREFLVPTRLTSSSSPQNSSSTPPLPSPSPPVSSSSTSSTSTFSSIPSPTATTTAHPLFYALPQSPQQPKQLLIASGAVDRYYQLARCFRDEDGRRDRQPEFTQVDVEMAWVSWGRGASASGSSAGSAAERTNKDGDGDKDVEEEDDGWHIGGTEVRDVVQRLVRDVWRAAEGVVLPARFPVLTYRDAMARFGSDKPDMRFGVELQDATPHLPPTAQDALARRGEVLEALVVRAADAPFRRAADAVVRGRELERGVGYFALGGDLATDNLGTNNHNLDLGTPGAPEALAQGLALRDGDVVFVARRTRVAEGGSTRLGRLRLALSSLAQTQTHTTNSPAHATLTLPPTPRFLWVTEFPLFTHADKDKEFLAHGRWSSSHHPFTAPMWEDVGELYGGRVGEVRGQHYDLVLNGTEIGGGSVRVHDPVMQEYIFDEILQLDATEKARFSHLLHALRCGAPPHGGIALGFDRLMAILCRAESIRDVIAFPKTASGTDLLFRSPAPATDAVLQEYNIRARS